MNESLPSEPTESPRDTGPIEVSEIDPAKIIPIEAAKAHLRHWWREPLAGAIAVGIGVYDSWFYGHDAGLSSSLDEILVIGGIVLMAGSKRLFTPSPAVLEEKAKK
jgi:hypothetical protein